MKSRIKELRENRRLIQEILASELNITSSRLVNMREISPQLKLIFLKG